jgi:hypothetical protein
VPRSLDPQPASVGQGAREAFGVLVEEHLALGTAQDEGRTANESDLLLQALEASTHGFEIERKAAVGLPGQPTVGQRAKVVPQADGQADLTG